jgi:hypothetical protein
LTAPPAPCAKDEIVGARIKKIKKASKIINFFKRYS